MSAFSIARGETFATTSTAKLSGKPVQLLPGTRVLFSAKVNPTDPDSAAIALLDNMALSGVVVANPSASLTDPLCGVFYVTMPATATYGLPSGQTTVLAYEIWIHDVSGNEWRGESGSITVAIRSLVQQP